jgi:hypothetical protein
VETSVQQISCQPIASKGTRAVGRNNCRSAFARNPMRRHKLSHLRGCLSVPRAARSPRCDDREMAGGRFSLLALSAMVWTVGCGGDAVARHAPGPSSVADARADRTDAHNNEHPIGRPTPIEAGVPIDHADATISVDASETTSIDANDSSWIADAMPVLCTTTPARDLDAGMCLGIYYATVARLVLWVEDRSAADGGSRVTLARTEGWFMSSMPTGRRARAVRASTC